jgi:hypothetical protein
MHTKKKPTEKNELKFRGKKKRKKEMFLNLEIDLS